ncbi:H(+)-transporting V1 sector ATPase subunit E [Sugiyamaella lignohabitans]|uniref:H(+)-transporting V1 sector ATPase subunit E n=1 Tax=Sugiyamaella lignohabitans TaxID=796027 RepID=A0A167EDX8_9ASCO|nr:H(+)-transporting V1 sector ATPase subunit E [Sugiyamaella lignohabitans]ANB13953.1 H(+)-transporting V1 sector ATPase subunit E [Sugiyamaella lignohabitans]
MPANQALSDDQVAGELQKMVEFIKKEADEKAKEIELKANEEYEIDKATVVRSETASIDHLYERKYKQSELSQQIAKSTIANQIRLKVLRAKEDALSEILEEAAQKLKTVANDKAKYETVLDGLIQEGLFALMDDKISLRVREADVGLVEKAIPSAIKAFEEKTSHTGTQVSIDKDNFLPKDSAGGVIIVNSTGKIDVDNTLEERLKLLSETSLPQIRLALFGASASRKHFD